MIKLHNLSERAQNNLWIILNFPGAIMLALLVISPSLWEPLTPYTGYLALFFFALTLVLNPLQKLFMSSVLVKMINRHRRVLGVASFTYAFIHVLCFLIKRGSFSEFLKYLIHPAILPGFIAFLIFIPLAITSNNASVKKLGFLRWKKLHKAAYTAEACVFVHLCFLSPKLGFATFIPLGVLQVLRMRKSKK